MKTLQKKNITPKLLQEVIRSKGYSFFTNNSKPFNLNLIGVRSSDIDSNEFNDFFILAYQTDTWVVKVFNATTDPGTVFRLKPINTKFGTGIMVPGQYKSAYERGIHARTTKFAHEALRQVAPVSLYRDKNKDAVLDMDPNTIQKGFYGINIHRANLNKDVESVDYYSAGCQVIQRSSDFFELMQTIRRAEKYWGKKFTYTLLEEDDFIPFL